MGINLIPMKEPVSHWDVIGFIQNTEASASSEELTLSNRDELLTKSGWARTFRVHRFVPAVEYIQANRARTLFIQEADNIFENVDIIAGSFINFSNLLGLPEVNIPNGFDKNGMPVGVSFTGRLFGETELLTFAHAYQKATDYHLRHPELD